MNFVKLKGKQSYECYAHKIGNAYNGSELTVNISVRDGLEIGKWAAAATLADWLLCEYTQFGIEDEEEAFKIAYAAREILEENITGEDECLAIEKAIKTLKKKGE